MLELIREIHPLEQFLLKDLIELSEISLSDQFLKMVTLIG